MTTRAVAGTLSANCRLHALGCPLAIGGVRDRVRQGARPLDSRQRRRHVRPDRGRTGAGRRQGRRHARPSRSGISHRVIRRDEGRDQILADPITSPRQLFVGGPTVDTRVTFFLGISGAGFFGQPINVRRGRERSRRTTSSIAVSRWPPSTRPPRTCAETGSGTRRAARSTRSRCFARRSSTGCEVSRVGEMPTSAVN